MNRRHFHDLAVAILSLCPAACGDALIDPGLPGTTEVLCDGSDRPRLTYLGEAGYTAVGTYWQGASYGISLFVIDGRCRYFAAGGRSPGLARLGVLSGRRAQEIERAVPLADIPRLASLPRAPCLIDSGEVRLRAGGTTVADCSAWDARSEVIDVLRAAGRIHDDLMAGGEDYQGPLRALTLPSEGNYQPPARLIFDWPLSFPPPAPAVNQQPSADWGRPIDDEADRKALRALRAIALASGLDPAEPYVRTGDGRLYILYLRDEAPDAVLRAAQAARSP
jgi:hypothetical protein